MDQTRKSIESRIIKLVAAYPSKDRRVLKSLRRTLVEMARMESQLDRERKEKSDRYRRKCIEYEYYDHNRSLDYLPFPVAKWRRVYDRFPHFRKWFEIIGLLEDLGVNPVSKSSADEDAIVTCRWYRIHWKVADTLAAHSSEVDQIAQLINELRKRGISQSDLAKALNIDRKTIRRWESGKVAIRNSQSFLDRLTDLKTSLFATNELESKVPH